MELVRRDLGGLWSTDTPLKRQWKRLYKAHGVERAKRQMPEEGQVRWIHTRNCPKEKKGKKPKGKKLKKRRLVPKGKK